MAALAGCPGVIVSSNNPADAVWPYAVSIYHHEPTKWDSLFPWEFPQNGAREDEESFLRNYFTEMDIYMHGGADGEGKGFKFLKTVWYTIATWNLEVRVPAVEKWYWEQPSNFALLEDPDMKDYYLRPDALPTTFFDSKEVDMYGEKFLTQVIPKIQGTAKIYIQQRQRDLKVNIIDVANYTTDMLKHELGSRAAIPAPQEAPALNQAAKDARHVIEPASAVQPPRPQIHEAHPSHPRNFSDGAAQAHDSQSGGFKRGGYGTQRFSRGTQHQVRGAIPFDGRHMMHYSSPTGGVPPIPVSMRTREASGGIGDYRTPNVDGQQLKEMHQSMQRVLTHQHIASYTPMPQHAVPYVAPHSAMDQPVWAITGAFQPHPKDQTGHYPTSAAMPLFEQNTFDPRHRRNSIRARGKGSYNGPRRGSQGRSSFGASDYNMHLNREAAFEGVRGGKHSHRARRFSGMSAGWRSSSDHPQLEQHGFGVKENIEPGRTFSAPDYTEARGYGVSGPMTAPRAQMKHQFESMANPEYQQQVQVQQYRPASQPFLGPQNAGDVREGNTCGSNWMSPTCTIVTKLIANGVPLDLPEHDIFTIFRQYGDVESVKRHVKLDRSINGLVFINFKHAQAARDFLENKPSTWLDDRPLNIEVAREYWDPEHRAYQRRMGNFGSYQQVSRRDSGANTETPSIPTILRRSDKDTNPFNSPYASPHFAPAQQSIKEVPSGETTPTPSRPGTPKKKGKGKGKKKNTNTTGVLSEHLRKMSLTVNADRAQAGVLDGNVTPKPSSPVSKEILTPSEPKLDIPTHATGSHEPIAGLPQAQIDQKAAEAEAPSSREPISGSDDSIKSQLHSNKTDDCSAKSQQDEVQPCEADVTDIKHAGQATAQAGGLVGQITVSTGEQLFRVDPSTKETEKTPHSSNVAPEGDRSETLDTSPPASASAAIRSRKELSLTDTSFHTASDSPHTSVETKTELLISEKPPVIQLPKLTVNAEDIEKTAADATTASIPDPAAMAVAAIVDHSPQTSMNPKSAIALVTEKCDPVEKEKKLDGRATSGSSLPPPTPAFVTAPNTPSIVHQQMSDDEGTRTEIASTKQEVTDAKAEHTGSIEDAEAVELNKSQRNVEEPASKSGKVESKIGVTKKEKSEKSEKAKGPAQTESLSLFGRKKDKKPKPSKKGSMKGKPNMEEKSSSTIGGKISQVVGGQLAGPTLGEPSSSTKYNRVENEDVRTTVAPTLDDSSEASKTSPRKPAEARNESDLDPSHDTSPSKGKAKLTTMFNRYFRGGAQSQTPALDATSPDTIPSDDVLTPLKEQGLQPESVTKQNDDEVVAEGGEDVPPSGEEDAASLFCGAASPTMESNHYALSESKEARVDDAGSSAVTGDDAVSKDDHGNGTVKSKKKKRKTKKKFLEVDDAATEASTESTPRVLRSAENRPASCSPVEPRSPASSVTQVGDTDPQPATSTASTAKPPSLLMPLNPNNGAIIQPKKPMWITRKQRLLASVETHDEDEVPSLEHDVTTTSSPSDTADESSVGEHTPPSDNGITVQGRMTNRIFVYVGPGRRNEMQDVGQGMMTKAEEREVAKARLRERELERRVAAAAGIAGDE